MTTLLKKLRDIPFRCTIKQKFSREESTSLTDRVNLDSPELWDELREESPHFSIPTDRESWLRMCLEETQKDGLDRDLATRAQALCNLMQVSAFDRVHSLGVGSGGFEYHLKKQCPDIYLTASDYPPKTVATLQQVFHECDEIRRFDLLGDEWGTYGNQPSLLVVLNRLDPLFTNDQWTDAFERMGNAGVINVLYLPAWNLTIKFWLSTLRRHISLNARRIPSGCNGWARNRKAQSEFWNRYYDVSEHQIGNLTGFLLKLNTSR